MYTVCIKFKFLQMFRIWNRYYRFKFFCKISGNTISPAGLSVELSKSISLVNKADFSRLPEMICFWQFSIPIFKFLYFTLKWDEKKTKAKQDASFLNLLLNCWLLTAPLRINDSESCQIL